MKRNEMTAYISNESANERCLKTSQYFTEVMKS